MPVDEHIFQSLLDMGIDAPLARAASERFSTPDAAVDWCFGPGGQNWKPEPVQPDGPIFPGMSGDTVTKPAAPSLPPRKPPATSVQPFQSLNPFLHSLPSVPSPTPTLQNDPEEEDEDLRKALAMSRGEEDDNRGERERSVRVTGAPPPSPAPTQDQEEGEVMQTLFGPSNKVEDGSTAVVPANVNPNTEDDDFNRALQESIMTASFHSASALREAEAAQLEPSEKEDRAPTVIYSQSGKWTFAALYLQALFSVPQIAEAILAAGEGDIESSHGSKASHLQSLSCAIFTSMKSFRPSDNELSALKDGHESIQFHPMDPTRDFHMTVAEVVIGLLRGSDQIKQAQASRLFTSSLHTPTANPTATYVSLNRQSTVPYNIYATLADLLWRPDEPGQSLLELGDLLTVFLGWEYGAKREVWEIEEQIVLDRFMKTNDARSLQIRADEAVANGNVRRLKEKVDGLTLYKDQNLHDSLASLIKHLDNTGSNAKNDPITDQSRQEMKSRLEHILSTLKEKVSALNTESEAEQKRASGVLFQTDDPSLNQHIYELKAILFHDGSLVAGKHLYGYFKNEDEWWKVQEHQIDSVAWETIIADRTGLFMDGGAYCLLYARTSPRPPPPARESNVASASTIIPSHSVNPPETWTDSSPSPSPSRSPLPAVVPQMETEVPTGDLVDTTVPSKTGHEEGEENEDGMEGIEVSQVTSTQGKEEVEDILMA